MNSKEKFLLFGILSCTLWMVVRAQVDGGWSPWSMHGTECTVTCGGGTQLKHRSCTNPVPEAEGDLCLKEDASNGTTESKTFPCNEESCFAGMFTNWTSCVNCTNSQIERYPLCDYDTACTDVEPETMICKMWNKKICPSPCKKVTCPEFGVCKDISTDEEPLTKCECTMGYKMNDDKTSCVRPAPTQPTRRPIPTLPPAQKTAATAISKSASSILIIFVGITLVLFLILRIFTPDRVIQMNMEIALICAHIFLMLPPTIYEMPALCKFVSICVHFFFTACFCFMMLEALHMYSLVAYIVKKDGLFTRFQYIAVGWGLSLIVVFCSVCFEWHNYGGEYHCWLQMNTNLFYAEFIPILIIVVVTLTLIEAAGAAEYKRLKGISQQQLFSARISQRTNLIILPFIIAHMFLGMMSEYEQNLPLYGTFSVMNGITGALVFFLHCSNNQQVRTKLKRAYHSMTRGSSP